MMQRSRKVKRYLTAVCLCPLLLAGCGNNTTAKTPPPEYVFKQIKTDFDFTAWKDNQQAATDKLQERLDYYASNACHGSGYGWGFTNVIDPGNVECEVNPDDQRVRCHQVDVNLECSRIKPGSVGMGMIPFTQ
jgi:hypothetical protein